MEVLKKSVKFYRLLNLLSVDVAVGAMCSAIFFDHIFQTDITHYSIISLGLTVWIIYTADHLLDARKTKTLATTNRHRFHQHYFSVLFVVMILATCINTVVLLYIRKPALITGIVLIVLVMLYLLIQQRLKFLKEIFVALVYTAGVLLPAASNTQMNWESWPWITIIQFFLIALLNLIIFSWFDFENDIQDKRASFVTIFGKKGGQVCIVILFIMVTMLLAYTFTTRLETVILIMMNAMLLFMFRFRSYFFLHDRYRLLGDAIFFLPVLILLF